MADTILADASPEKRLFISLIMRDISLIDAFLDLIDNSINAALEPHADALKTADDYQRVFASRLTPKVSVDVSVSSSKITVTDTASGISSKMAADHVFKFGRDEGDAEPSDRLSVYGIGLKRAMFKCGNRVKIISDHKRGGFELDLDVKRWAKKKGEPWTFEITERQPVRKDFGTTIEISELYGHVT